MRRDEAPKHSSPVPDVDEGVVMDVESPSVCSARIENADHGTCFSDSNDEAYIDDATFMH